MTIHCFFVRATLYRYKLSKKKFVQTLFFVHGFLCALYVTSFTSPFIFVKNARKISLYRVQRFKKNLCTRPKKFVSYKKKTVPYISAALKKHWPEYMNTFTHHFYYSNFKFAPDFPSSKNLPDNPRIPRMCENRNF